MIIIIQCVWNRVTREKRKTGKWFSFLKSSSTWPLEIDMKGKLNYRLFLKLSLFHEQENLLGNFDEFAKRKTEILSELY